MSAREKIGTVLLERKVEKFNLSEVKTLLDDCLKKLMNDGFKYSESHKHMNTKLLLGYPAAAVAGSVALYNWKVPFEECREIVALGVLIYFILNSALMLYIWYVEGSTVYVGYKGNKLVELKSILKNYNPTYKLTLTVSADGKTKKTAELNTLVSSWVDIEGKLAPEPFVSGITKFLEAHGGA